MIINNINNKNNTIQYEINKDECAGQKLYISPSNKISKV